MKIDLRRVFRKVRNGVVIGLVVPFSACGQEMGWDIVDEMIESDFPSVRHISTDSLAAWLADTTRERPLLLDARSVEEYRVSHLQGAVHVDPEATVFPGLDSIDRDRPIVAYCSVGYRSSRTAERLEAVGFTNVVNLEGSIFRWANEGRPVWRDGEEVREVHPYDALWGRLLNDGIHADNQVIETP